MSAPVPPLPPLPPLPPHELFPQTAKERATLARAALSTTEEQIIEKYDILFLPLSGGVLDLNGKTVHGKRTCIGLWYDEWSTVYIENAENLEDGGPCPCCDRALTIAEIENCSCHIYAPCSSCVDSRLVCEYCGWST